MWKFYAWYDRQPEAKRFLIFIGLIIACTLPIEIGFALKSVYISALAMLLLPLLLVTRMYYKDFYKPKSRT